MKALSAVLRTAIAALALAAGSASAQSYPSRPITMIVPFAAGGTADILGRLLAQHLATDLKQNVIVELKPGAGSMLGSEIVAKVAPADGYTVLLNGPPLSINASLMSLNFDPGRDLVPASGIAGFPQLMVTSASSPYRTVQDVVKAAKGGANLTFGSSGPGTASHMAGELFGSLAGVSLTHVPYKGSGAVYTDLIAERVNLLFDVAGSAIGFVSGGKVRAIGITSKERSAALPDVPTLLEQGVTAYEFLSWFGLFVRAGTPPEVVARLEVAARNALNEPAMQERLKQLGAMPLPISAAEFGRFYQADIDRWAGLVRAGKVARLN